MNVSYAVSSHCLRKPTQHLDALVDGNKRQFTNVSNRESREKHRETEWGKDCFRKMKVTLAISAASASSSIAVNPLICLVYEYKMASLAFSSLFLRIIMK